MNATRQKLAWAVFAAALVLVGWGAVRMMFSTYMFYDDEGYMLISVRNFNEHGHLYREVYSQYGPAPYIFYYILNLAGLPVSHTVGRVLTLLAWAGCAGLAGAVTFRATQRLAAGVAVLAFTFCYLWIMVSEPTHPGGIIAFLSAVMGLVGFELLARDRDRAWAILAGAGTAVMLLTKINVGIFAGMSAIAFYTIYHRQPGIRRAAPVVCGLLFALVPFGLMHSLLGTPWVRTYAWLFILASIPAIGTVALGSFARWSWRTARPGILAAVAVAAFILVIIFARGTSPRELLEGTLLGPLRHPSRFSLSFPWPPWSRPLAIASAVAFLPAIYFRTGAARRRVDRAVALARLAATLALAVVLCRFPAISPDNLVFASAVSLLWIFLWPLGERPDAVAAKNWLGLFFLGQFLHPYPVPGSQIAWGTFLAIPLAAIGASEAAAWLGAELRERAPSAAGVKRVKRAMAGVAAAVTLAVFGAATWGGWQLYSIGRDHYADGRDLDLPGSGPLRLPDNTTALYRILALNAVAHSDLLYSLPGMFSLNLWTGLPTPTLANVTHWFSLLDEPEQRATVAALAAHPRSVVIIQRGHVKFLGERGLQPAGIIHDYIEANYIPAFTIDEFEFCVRRGRTIAPLMTGEILELSAAAGQTRTAQADTLLQLDLLLSPEQRVGSIVLQRIDHGHLEELILSEANCRLEVTPLALNGQPRGVPVAAKFPVSLEGPATVAIYFDRGRQSFSLKNTLIIVRGAAGEELALARLRE